jgi:hypothetical protein
MISITTSIFIQGIAGIYRGGIHLLDFKKILLGDHREILFAIYQLWDINVVS